jgi:hypothetical protein
MRDAMAHSRYVPDPHFSKRCFERRVGMADVRRLLQDCTPESVSAYNEGVPRAGGTCWRFRGVDLDEMELVLGAEIFRDHLGRRAILLTVFG